ncbi:MAG TPA: acyl-CoA dehydrogenase family protein [Acidimicrobiales bacterium]|nr:acyl-CoA dehydrogenase family protein [Acidimicrobiales bacterium]
MTTIMTRETALLTDDMLHRFDERAPLYDRENRFFGEDFEELRASGYLSAAVPVELGGAGLRLDEVMRLQRKLAYVAPATAVAVNMHLYWTGMAADMARFGDTRCQMILEQAADGHVFAAGHGEAGNDMGLFGSTTQCRKVPGGWEITGRKVFGSLSPVWSYLGFHAMDTSDPENPVVIHGFLPRDAAGYRVEETWDALGMRATASQDTVFDGTFVPDELVPVVTPMGAAGADLFHLCLFAWGLLGFGNVYIGAARRAYDLVVESSGKRGAIGLTRSTAHNPEVQRGVAEMRMALEATDSYLDRVCDEWAEGVDHGADWAVKIVSAKHFAVTKAFEIVDTALDLTGGSGLFKRSRIEQLFRDVRLGRIHPANRLAVYEIVGKASLGIDPDAQPRWG